MLKCSKELGCVDAFTRACERKSDPNGLKPRRSMCIFAIGGDDVTVSDITIEQYTHRFNKWKLIGRIPEECHRYSVVQVGETVWILGGQDQNEIAVPKVQCMFN